MRYIRCVFFFFCGGIPFFPASFVYPAMELTKSVDPVSIPVATDKSIWAKRGSKGDLRRVPSSKVLHFGLPVRF